MDVISSSPSQNFSGPPLVLGLGHYWQAQSSLRPPTIGPSTFRVETNIHNGWWYDLASGIRIP